MINLNLFFIGVLASIMLLAACTTPNLTKKLDPDAAAEQLRSCADIECFKNLPDLIEIEPSIAGGDSTRLLFLLKRSHSFPLVKDPLGEGYGANGYGTAGKGIMDLTNVFEASVVDRLPSARKMLVEVICMTSEKCQRIVMVKSDGIAFIWRGANAAEENAYRNSIFQMMEEI